jgi:CBS domain-containing protein
MPMLARDLMQTEPITIPADRPFLEVVALFVEAQIGGAPVVDPDGAIVGILSESDLLRALDQALDDEIDDAEATDGDAVARLGALTALHLASPEVIWVGPETPIAHVAKRMLGEGIHRVLVGDGRRLDGVLTSFDLLRAVGA